MLTSILSTIALLCLNPNGSQGTGENVRRDKERLGCQRYYLRCLKKRTKRNTIAKLGELTHDGISVELGECILKRN